LIFYLISREQWLAQSVPILGYGVDDQGLIPGRDRIVIFFLHHRVQTGCGSHPASQPMGIGAFSPVVKQPGREADHSPLPIADVLKCSK